MLLSEENYHVHTAETMAEACSMAMMTKYDLYVLDKRLPDGTGVQLCEVLTKLPPTCRASSTLATLMRFTARSARAGAAAYVAKPDIEA
jgi:DNA-binding response OmpR family regulator